MRPITNIYKKFANGGKNPNGEGETGDEIYQLLKMLSEHSTKPSEITPPTGGDPNPNGGGDTGYEIYALLKMLRQHSTKPEVFPEGWIDPSIFEPKTTREEGLDLIRGIAKGSKHGHFYSGGKTLRLTKK